jgi:serine/threonine protein kinase
MRGWGALARKPLDPNKLKVTGMLGRVLLGEYDGRTVVVKESGPNEKYLRSGLIECSAYESLRCPTLLQSLGHCEHHDKKQGKLLRLALEYAPFGSLGSICKQTLSGGERTADGLDVSLRQRVQWLQHIIKAVYYLHKCGVMHRDIKPYNVMLRADLTAVLADLQSSRRLGSELSGVSSVLMTSGFIAPEIQAQQDRRTYAADVYSFGITIVSVLVGSIYPVRDACLGQLMELSEVIPHYSSRLALLHDIAERCTRSEPQRRPSARKLRSWFDRLLRDWDMLEQFPIVQWDTLSNCLQESPKLAADRLDRWLQGGGDEAPNPSSATSSMPDFLGRSSSQHRMAMALALRFLMQKRFCLKQSIILRRAHM